MQAYEVSAALVVADRATGPMTKVLELSEKLAASFERIKELSPGLFSGTGANRFATQLGRLDPALQSVTDNLARTKNAAGFAFGSMDASISSTLDQVRALNASFAEAAASAKTMGVAAGVGSRVAGVEAAAAAGHGGGRGFHTSGSVPIPMGPMDGHARFGLTPKMAAAGAIGWGLYEDVNLADAVAKIIYTAGGTPGNISYQAETGRLRRQILDIYSKTGMPLADIENAAVGMTRMLAPLPLAQRAGLFNQVISAAAMESRLKGGSIEQNAEAMTGLLHQAAIYDPKQISKLLPAFTYAALYDPQTVTQMTKAASYALPVLRTTMGIDPVDTIMSIALMQSSGITSTKAGTWLNAAELGLMPGTKILTGTTAARHADALRKLGLVNTQGQSLFMNAEGQFMAGAAMAQMIKSLKGIPHDQWAAIFQALAGTQGSRYLAIMTDPVVANRGAELLSGVSAYSKRQGEFWAEYGAGSPAQNARTAFAEFTRSLMDLSAIVLPAFTDAMKAATSVLGGVRSILEGAGLQNANTLTSWAAVGGAAYLLSSRVRAGVGAAASFGSGAAARLGIAGALPWLGAAGAVAGLGYLDWEKYKSISKQTGAPWYSFIPGAEFFGADPLDYLKKQHHIAKIAAAGVAGRGHLDQEKWRTLSKQTAAPWYSFIPGAEFFGADQFSYAREHSHATNGAAEADDGSMLGGLASVIESGMRRGLNGIKVVLDGELVGHLVTEAQAAEARKPPSGPSSFDNSLSPAYPTGGL